MPDNGMACFGCLFRKKKKKQKPSRFGKGKDAAGTSKSDPGTSKKFTGSSKRSQSSKRTTENLAMIELRKKIMSFRELVNLPPCIGSSVIIELMRHTVKELSKLYPDVLRCDSVSDSEGAMDKVMTELCVSIESLGKHWMHNDDWMVKSKTNDDLEKHLLDLLDDIINIARERMHNKTEMDNDKEIKEIVDPPSCSNGKSSSKSLIPEFINNKSAKIDPHVVAVHEVTDKDGNVRVHMEISVPPSSLKSIVDSENVQLITDAGALLSSSSQRPSISAAVVGAPPQVLDSEESQLLRPPPPHELESKILPPDASSLASRGILPPPLPPPPPPPLPSEGNGDMSAQVSPVPPTSMPTSNTNSVSPPPPPPPPPPPQLVTTNNITTPFPCSLEPPSPPPPPPPPTTSGNAIPMAPGIPPPTAPGSVPPPSLAAPGKVPPPPPPPTAPGRVPPPPPPSVASSNGSSPPPPPHGKQRKEGAPPPPPAVGGNGKLLRKSASKLKRSSQMGCLYRQLKAKVEGSSGTKNRSTQKKGGKVGASSGGNEQKGMADALAEMTKRSSYFQQIEEDVKNYSDSIKEVKAAIVSFQTTDMNELIKFHKYVESHLEKLTDETQVLARFEDFPSKKLEGLRMAAALYSKLDAIATTLQDWKIEPPANQLLDRIENYFNKIKEELDTLDRTKDEEVKKFKSQKIHFDFSILIRIKESMVDVSSGCMELALQEKKLASSSKRNSKKANPGKVLWKAFQFAFRVYSFAGGQDDRAENLTKELAQLIQSESGQ